MHLLNKKLVKVKRVPCEFENLMLYQLELSKIGRYYVCFFLIGSLGNMCHVLFVHMLLISTLDVRSCFFLFMVF